MIRKDIEKIECTIMPLTDIHIGSGIDLASYEYVIKDGVFYRIDLGEIFYNFPEDMRLKLTELMEENNIIKIRKYIKDNYKVEYGYSYSCEVADDVNELYEEKIGGARNSNDENSLTISEFIGNYRGKYIPGSSIKGSIRNAYIGDNFQGSYEIMRNKKINTAPFIIAKEKEYLARKIEAEALGLKELEPKFDPFKNLQVTDSEISKDMLKIVKVERVNLKKDKINVPMGNHEMMRGYLLSRDKKSLKFEINISELSFDRESEIKYRNLSQNKKGETIIEELNKELYVDSVLFPALREKSNKVLEEDLKFFREAKNLIGIKACEEIKNYSATLKENEVLIKFGKGAGFNSTTLNLFNRNKKDVFTRVMAEGYPVGWAVLSYNEE